MLNWNLMATGLLGEKLIFSASFGLSKFYEILIVCFSRPFKNNLNDVDTVNVRGKIVYL